jgi:hypothetical protein
MKLDAMPDAAGCACGKCLFTKFDAIGRTGGEKWLRPGGVIWDAAA